MNKTAQYVAATLKKQLITECFMCKRKLLIKCTSEPTSTKYICSECKPTEQVYYHPIRLGELLE